LLAGGGFFSFFGMRAWGIVREEEKRKKMEEALRASEDRYRFLFEAAPVGIALTNSEGRIRDANSFLLKILGYTVEEARNLAVEAVYVNPDDRLRLLDAMQLHGYLREWEVLFRRKDGSVFDGLLDARKIEYGGEPLFLTTIRDITDLRRGEGERRVLEERLSRMEKMESLGMLAGGVAHDLNNVLGILVGYSELLLDDLDPDSPLREHVRNILLGGERAAAIVQDLLTMARRGVQNRDVVNLNTIIAELQATPEYAKLCSSHSGVRVEALLEAELLNIQGSPVHLSKTLLNLLNNAMEAMRRGGRVTIRTENLYLDHPVAGYDEVREGDYVLLSVTDAGEGIAPENLKRIFEPFYTKKVMGRSGTGLGLAVVWGTVKDHGGYIDIRSEPGKGSTFSLYFPVTREEGVRPETVAPVAYSGRGESLLVIDDVQEQRELAVMMLTKLGYRVEALSSGEEAVEYLKQKKMDLVVLDMIMDPGMDGLDTYKEILKLHPKQKAIIVSGFAETDRVRSAQELGAGAYVKKPYMLGRIGMAVRKELDRI
jgi:two-component system cell cycle sensor histidine kinase/response regulator CckA